MPQDKTLVLRPNVPVVVTVAVIVVAIAAVVVTPLAIQQLDIELRTVIRRLAPPLLALENLRLLVRRDVHRGPGGNIQNKPPFHGVEASA